MSNPFESPAVQKTSAPGRSQYRIKRLSVISVGVFSATATMIFSFLPIGIALMFALVGPRGMGLGRISADAVKSLLLTPLLYGVAGFVGGVIQAVVYNVIAGMTGGITLELERD